MFAKNRARLGIERASQMIFLAENHVFTEFSEAELLDLSLEDDAWGAPRRVIASSVSLQLLSSVKIDMIALICHYVCQ